MSSLQTLALMDSACWVPKIIRTHGVSLHNFPEDTTWQR